MAIKKNLAWNYINFVTSAVVGFVVNPLLLMFLGAAPFGAWKSLQRYFDVAVAGDGGAPQALKWLIAHQSSGENIGQKRRAVGAAVLVWAAWLPVTILISIVLVLTIPHAMSGVPSELRASLTQAAVVLSINICLSGMLAIPTAALIGSNNGYRSMAINVLVTLVTNGLLVAVSFAGGGLIGLAAIMFAGSALNFFIAWSSCAKHIRWWGINRPPRDEFIGVAKHSGWVLGWSYVQRLLLSSDLILISIFLGVLSVTAYTFTSYLSQFVLGICIMTTSAFMPRLGSMIGSNDLHSSKKVASQMKEINFAIVAFTSSLILAFNNVFISLWVGSDHYLGDIANLIIVLSVAQTALIRNDSQLLDAALSVRGRALIGAVGCLIAVAGGSIGYVIFHSPEGLLAGALLGRVGLMVGFTRLLSSAIPGAHLPLASYIFGTALLIPSYFLGTFTSGLAPIPAVLFGFVAITFIALYVYFAILTSSTRMLLGNQVFKIIRKG